MDRNAIIDFMFDELENTEVIDLKRNTEYLNNLKIEDEKAIKVFNCLKKHIYSKDVRNNLKMLIEDYIDSCRDTTYIEIKFTIIMALLMELNFLVGSHNKFTLYGIYRVNFKQKIYVT